MYREQGNKLFSHRHLFKALECYNKSLLVADMNSIDVALAYANRSAVYMTAKEYQLCLENIDLARQAGYPENKMAVLDDREKRSMDGLNGIHDTNDPWSFFKLSYPANEKIPFISNCLELKQNTRFGRHIVTNKDLYPGEIIAVEEPLFVELSPDVLHLRCVACAKSRKMSLIVNESFANALFCSNECIEKMSKIIPRELRKDLQVVMSGKYLFESLSICGGSFEKLEQLMDPALLSVTIFDFDFSDPNAPSYKYQMLLAFNSLCRSPLNYGQKCWIDETAASQLRSC